MSLHGPWDFAKALGAKKRLKKRERMKRIKIVIFWNPKDLDKAQEDVEAIVREIEALSNSEPKALHNELGYIQADCTSLKTVEGQGN